MAFLLLGSLTMDCLDEPSPSTKSHFGQGDRLTATINGAQLF